MGFSASGMDPFGRSQKDQDMSHDAMDDRTNLIANTAKPETFQAFYDSLLQTYLNQFEPGRMQAADIAGNFEQNNLRGADADYGRRGMSGSGAHMASRQGVRTGRAAMNNDAMIQMWLAAMQGASGGAQDLINTRVAGYTGTPVERKGRGSNWYEWATPSSVSVGM